MEAKILNNYVLTVVQNWNHGQDTRRGKFPSQLFLQIWKRFTAQSGTPLLQELQDFKDVCAPHHLQLMNSMRSQFSIWGAPASHKTVLIQCCKRNKVFDRYCPCKRARHVKQLRQQQNCLCGHASKCLFPGPSKVPGNTKMSRHLVGQKCLRFEQRKLWTREFHPTKEDFELQIQYP